MLKTILVSSDDAQQFQDSINEHIKDKDVVDIRYQTAVIHKKWQNGVPIESTFVDRALIMYREVEEKNEEPPSDDAMDAIRARWRTTTDPVNGTVTFVCTHCGETITIPSMGAIPYATCPGCHAIMF